MQQLRHVVLFAFFDVCTPEEVRSVENAFNALAGKIPTIQHYEWGINNSPEKINSGYTHCYYLTFNSEKDRDDYAFNNPDHQAFKALIKPYVSQSLVIDYWAR